MGTETLDSQRAAVNQVRLGTELSQQLRLGGLTLAPFGEAHLRRDGGAGQPGTGLELSGGLRAQAGFLRIDTQGRLLAVHSVAGYEERGLGLTVSLGNPGGEGLSRRRLRRRARTVWLPLIGPGQARTRGRLSQSSPE
ncbi:MAG: hypothetical protein F4037_07670 [Gemmatimonadales bacterium]|nr:hypothetical protein [Gemmatimonadales bacterium]MYK01809.1 hypothetical protein [Candidatus Palauibacter ramosifaciens]